LSSRAHNELRNVPLVAVTFAAVFVALAPVGCGKDKEPEKSTYFERTIGPILTTSCTRTNTGAACHVADAKGNALGNLDTSSYAGVALRPDLLVSYGPYGQPAFLVKNVPPYQIEVQTYDGKKVVVTTDIKHAGGSIFDPTESAYQTLRRWIENGATENNAGKPPPKLDRLPCTTVIPTDPAFDPSKDPATRDFGTFRDKVSPILGKSCAAGNCHGTASNELYLTCGESPEQVRWNYFSASQYLAQTPEQSEIVRRPLAPEQGGSFHEGGAIFDSTSNPDYRTIFDWAVEHGPPQVGQESPAFTFFAHRVQPVLVRKGCMMLHCHAAPLFHDYRLRGGSGGSFSLSATKRNHELSLRMSSLESEDPNASRMVRKNLYRPEVFDGGQGIAHRGGPLFEDFPKAASVDQCAAGNYDYDDGDLDKIPAYCVIAEWLRRERAEQKLAPLTQIVYVKRAIPAGPDRAQDFDVFAPGAELHRARVVVQGGTIKVDEDFVVKTCGFDSADIKRPAVSWDGKKIAFAARTSESDRLQIYEMNADGSACAKHPEINAGPATENGLLVHNFDPAYGPPDARGAQRIVFASTRGNPKKDSVWDYSGPQRTPADPSKPNANLYVFEPDPARPGAGRIKQLTFLLNMERQPSFMSDGRVIFTAEKRAPGFHQLALRRINLDGGDYHPLYAQRGSIGYLEATNVIETLDKNFVAVLSDRGAVHGAGSLGVVNRSIGVDFTSKRAQDYPIDATVIDPNAPASPDPNFFLRSLRILKPTIAGAPQSGVFTSPSPLPNGKILASFGPGDEKTFSGDYDLYVVDPITGEMTKLLGEPGKAEIEAVAVYQRQNHGIFASSLDEPNGHTSIREGRDEADLLVVDFPVLASLLFQNTPTGRVVESFAQVEVWEDLPPPLDLTSFGAGNPNVANDEYGSVYVRRRLLGTVPLAKDGSARFTVPGGVPLVLHLPDTDLSRERKLPRWQREQYVFAPGEYAHQSFRREFFDGFCGQCHGAISGRPLDVNVQPDMLTQASSVEARNLSPVNANIPPSARQTVTGPPASP
jgi:hypothetical protein